MNIDLFTERRKQLGYSQLELCDGICTQATLSRLENNGQVPSMKILVRLCNRLQLDLATLFPSVSVQDSETNKLLEQAEFSMIKMEYTHAIASLNDLDFHKLTTDIQKLQYTYLKGFLAILTELPISDALFYFNQLIAETTSDHYPLFMLLGYTGLGFAYATHNELDKAEVFFEKAIQNIYTYPLHTLEDVLRVLHILFRCAGFYAQLQDYETSDALLQHGIEICSDNHTTFYLARIHYQLAVNLIGRQAPYEQVHELLISARAFAKINRNNILINHIQTAIDQLD